MCWQPPLGRRAAGPGQARRLACGQGCFQVQVRLKYLVVGLLLQRGRQLLVRLRSTPQTDECSRNAPHSMRHEENYWNV